jgi:uroporphyrinogen III methyltransferase/synthase
VTARVLVTRPAGTWLQLTARFAGTGVVLQMSETTVQVDPIDGRPGDVAIDRLAGYDWLVVTSGRGVAALRARLAARGLTDLPPDLHVAAVGPATAAALSAAGHRVDLVAGEASSDGLYAALARHAAGGARLLIIRPEGAPGSLAAALRAAGGTVDEAPLYRTIASHGAGALADAAIAGAFAAVVFTAPSALDCWLDAAGAQRDDLVSALKRAARVAIGPTTKARLSAAGLPAAATADAPNENAVGDALSRALGVDLLP